MSSDKPSAPDQDCSFLFNTTNLANANDMLLSTHFQKAPGTNPDVVESLRNQSSTNYHTAFNQASFKITTETPSTSSRKRKTPIIHDVVDLANDDQGQTLSQQPHESVHINENDNVDVHVNKKAKFNCNVGLGDDNDGGDDNELINVDDFSMDNFEAIQNNRNDSLQYSFLNQTSGEFANLLDVMWYPTTNSPALTSTIHAATPNQTHSRDSEDGNLILNIHKKDSHESFGHRKPINSNLHKDSDGEGDNDNQNTKSLQNPNNSNNGHNTSSAVPITVRCKLCLGVGHSRTDCRYNVDYFPCSVCGIPGHALSDHCPGRYCHRCLSKHGANTICKPPQYPITQYDSHNKNNSDHFSDASLINNYLNTFYRIVKQREINNARAGHRNKSRRSALASCPISISTRDFITLNTCPVCLHCGSSFHETALCTFDTVIPHTVNAKEKQKNKNHELLQKTDLSPEQAQAISEFLIHTKCALCGAYGHSYCDTSTQTSTGVQPVVEIIYSNDIPSTTHTDNNSKQDCNDFTKTQYPLTNPLNVASIYPPIARPGFSQYKQQCGICSQTNHLPGSCPLTRPNHDRNLYTMTDAGKITGGPRIFNIYNEELSLITSRIVKNGFACTICNRQGHNASACPNRKCFQCNQTGHDKASCPERAGNSRHNSYSGGGDRDGNYGRKSYDNGHNNSNRYNSSHTNNWNKDPKRLSNHSHNKR